VYFILVSHLSLDEPYSNYSVVTYVASDNHIGKHRDRATSLSMFLYGKISYYIIYFKYKENLHNVKIFRIVFRPYGFFFFLA